MSNNVARMLIDAGIKILRGKGPEGAGFPIGSRPKIKGELIDLKADKNEVNSLNMGVLIGIVEDAGSQEVFIGPHVNKDGKHEFQDVG